MSKNQNSGTDTLKAEIQQNVLELQRRGTLFGKLNALFQDAGFESTNSTENIIKKIAKLKSENNEKHLAKFDELLKFELEKSIKYTNKQVYLYALENDQLINTFNVIKTLKDLNIEDDKTKSKFFVHNIDEKDPEFKIIFLKSSRKRFEYKEINDDDLKRAATDSNEELVRLIKQVGYPMNCYDFIAFDFLKNKLIIGGDLIDTFKSSETEKAISQITQQFEKISDLKLDVWDLRKSVSAFEEEKTGKDSLLDVGLTTADGGFRYSGKTATNRQDLSDDSFYQEGKKASNADSYKVKKLYDISDKDIEEKVTITLGLKYREYHKIPALKVRFAIIDNVQRLSGLKFAIRKLIKNNI